MLSTVLALFAVLAASINASAQDDCTQFSGLTPPVVKDMDGRQVNSTRADQLVIIFSTFSNPCGHDQKITVITEARTADNATAFFHSATVDAGAFDTSEVGALWYPKSGGIYELRSFAISESRILTGVQTRELEVLDYESVRDTIVDDRVSVALQR